MSVPGCPSGEAYFGKDDEDLLLRDFGRKGFSPYPGEAILHSLIAIGPSSLPTRTQAKCKSSAFIKSFSA
jgi:hypothetical protein